MASSPNGDAAVASAAPKSSSWREIVAKYQHTEVPRALVQLVMTLLPLAVGFTLMFVSLAWPYWVTLLLAIPTAGFLVRTFIIMHDCAHSSFLPWRRDHAIHHASSGDLDRRGHGDVHTIKVREYLARSPLERFKYRMTRQPV